MGTKKVRIYGKGAPQKFGGGSCPKLPPSRIRHWYETNIASGLCRSDILYLGFSRQRIPHLQNTVTPPEFF